MMAVMILTFVFLMRVVINTGLLVSAKINIQNAADLAAYAGAAAQARTLNHVAFLNYEMRRQLKKYLFRYYVLGNLSQARFPDSGAQTYNFSPDGTTAYGVPSACIIFDARDNYCQMTVNPAIANVTANPLDPISVSLNATLANIEQIRQAQCAGIGVMNRLLVLLWLFNADPELEDVRAAVANAPGQKDDVLKALGAIQGLSRGLGLFPRNLLTLMRIKTLEHFLNAPPLVVRLADVQNLEGSADPMESERTILAFYSAFKTLGEYMFDDSTIELHELLPGDSDKSQMAEFKPISVDLASYFVFLELAQNASNNTDCESKPQLVKAEGVPLGVEKNPDLLTYYAIRLEADARPMFSPLGIGQKVRLKAYAAAQPFGSRVGPSLSKLQESGGFTVDRQPTTATASAGVPGIPNIPMRLDDSAAIGWFRTDTLRTMLNTLTSAGNAGALLTAADFERGYAAAMAPNVNEPPLYNIIHDLDADGSSPNAADDFVSYFSDGPYRIWAPIVPASQASAGIDEVLQTAFLAAAADLDPVVRAPLLVAFTTYVQRLNSAAGENGETFNVALLTDSRKTMGADGAPQPIAHDLAVVDPKLLRTSWSALKHSAFSEKGRLGYSVKLVPFNFLFNPQGGSSDLETPWINRPQLDATAQAEIGENAELITH